MLGASAAFVAALLAASPGQDPDALASGRELLERKEFAEAEAAFRRAVAEDRTSARAYGGLALALMSEGKVEEAVEKGYLAAALDPGSVEARVFTLHRVQVTESRVLAQAQRDNVRFQLPDLVPARRRARVTNHHSLASAHPEAGSPKPRDFQRHVPILRGPPEPGN